jgi:hypothetical protein
MYELHMRLAQPLRDELRCSLMHWARIGFLAVEDISPVAQKRLDSRTDDGSELYDGELAAAIAKARPTSQGASGAR